MTDRELQQLRDRRFDLWHEAKKFLDDHTDKDGKISQFDTDRYMIMEKTLRELDNAIELHTRRNERESNYNQLTTSPVLDSFKYDGATGKFTYGDFQMKSTNEYRKNFVNAIRSHFRDHTFVNMLSTTGDGGYLIDDEMNNEIVMQLEQKNFLREISTTIQTQSDRKIPILTNPPSCSWTAEGESINFDSDVAYTQTAIGAFKLTSSVKITNELLYDNNFDLVTHIENLFTESAARYEVDAMLNGQSSDTSRPTGIITEIAADSDMYISSSSANTISSDDVISLVYELPREYRKNACFVMSDETAAVIRKLKNGTQDYIWQQNYQAGEPELLCGYRVYTTPFMPQIASGNIALVFGNFRYFYIAERGQRTFRELRELFAANDITGFLMTERLDSRIIQKNAFRGLKIK